jgi:hypothetical protein
MALDALNILDHQAKRFGVVTVIDATLFDLVTGEPILELDTLKMANIATEAEEKEIRGGKQASQLIIYDYARTASMEMQDALGSIASMQYMFGSQLSEANVTKHVKDKARAVSDASVVTLTSAPFIGTKLAVAQADGLGTTATYNVVAYDAAGPAAGQAMLGNATPAVITLGTDAFDEENVDVFFETLAASGAQQLTLSTTSFSNNVKIVGKTFVLDQATGVRKAAELVIHNFQLNPTFELAFDSEGEASVFDFSGRALQDSEGRFITIKYLNENF